MFLLLQVVTVLLASVAMALALSHALEFPGKLRLDKATYVAMQPIYYPGFTIGGGVGEGLGIIAALALLLMTQNGTPAFWWTLVGLIALLAMHGAYWIVTHPVNKFWLKDQSIGRAGSSFFGLRPGDRRAETATDATWERARDRWEYSHVLRAVLGVVAVVSLTIAVAI
jgi:hypothetical protein